MLKAAYKTVSILPIQDFFFPHCNFCVFTKLYIPNSTVKLVLKKNAASSAPLPNIFYLDKIHYITVTSNVALNPTEVV